MCAKRYLFFHIYLYISYLRPNKCVIVSSTFYVKQTNLTVDSLLIFGPIENKDVFKLCNHKQ